MTITEKSICKFTAYFKMAGLYFHIPFCKQACHYCDFHFSTNLTESQSVVESMGAELDLQKDYLRNQPVQTIYFGGGTPSLLSRNAIEGLTLKSKSVFTVTPDAEVTLEANPDDLSPEKLETLKGAGINRLSVGIQSFQDDLLKFLNRAHNSQLARECLENIRRTGFNNISIDLIYGIPALSLDHWKETIAEAIRFSPEHISTYALTIEEKTVFGHWRKKGKLKAIDEETEALQFELLMDMLGDAGYRQYEISNFAKPGFISRHNSSYWKQSHYLGIGPSAHSYNGLSRQFNVRNNAQYVRSIQQGLVPFDREILSDENKINEYLLTGLRTDWGCDLDFLRNVLKDDLLIRRGSYLNQILSQGLVSLEDKTLRLTRKGRLLADKIAEDLIVAP